MLVSNLGGIAAQLILTITVVILFGFHFHDFCWAQHWTIANPFVLANIIAIPFNLIPFRRTFKTKAGKISYQSDGFQVLKTLLMKSAELEKMFLMSNYIEALFLYEEKKYKEAIEHYEAFLKTNPSTIIAFIGIAACYTKQLDIDAGIRTLENLSMPETDPLAKTVYNDLAWFYLLLGRKDCLDLADRLSSKAYALDPHSRNIQGTRGSILIEIGAIDEGLRLLKPLINLYRIPNLLL